MGTHRCPEPSCSFFNQVLPHNAKVCPMCGTPLGQAVQAPSETRNSYAQPFSLTTQSTAVTGEADRPQLQLHHPSGPSFVLIRESGVIGRQNLSSGSRPEIDLTNMPHAGVISRTHAHLFWDAGQSTYMVVDDSRNGSYLNGELLARGAPHPIQQGDELQLGQDRLICLRVELKQPANQLA
ncbi:MAG: FHA domain-containing protein [Thermosynechococcaceae cyanobacterium]